MLLKATTGLLALFTLLKLTCGQSTTAAPFNCPTSDELHGCVCTLSLRQLHCPKTAKPMVFIQPYHFSSVVVEAEDSLANLFAHVREGYLRADSLRVNNFSAPAGMSGQLRVNELEALLAIVEKSLVIFAMTGATLDANNLKHETLESLSIHRMHLANIDFQQLKSLKKLEIIDTVFPDDVLQFDASSLANVKISGSNLRVAKIKADTCKANDPVQGKIQILLQHNPQLESFNFDSLKLTADDSGCYYYVDLSENPKLSPTLLSDNQELIKKSKPGQLFLIVRDVPQHCTVCLQKLVLGSHAGWIHSVQCNNEGEDVKDKYLDDLTQKGITALGNTDCP